MIPVVGNDSAEGWCSHGRNHCGVAESLKFKISKENRFAFV